MDHKTLQAEGWRPMVVDGFIGLCGPLWMRGEGDELAVGLLLEDHHSNNHLGTVHGGVLMTLADVGLGSGVHASLGGANCVTVSLQTQFVSVARTGEFLHCRSEVIRKSRSIVFVRGLVCVGDKVVASAEGVWKVLEQRAEQ